MAIQEEEILWKDRKHWLWFPFSFTKYEVSKNRLYVQKGLFKTIYDETLLYRVVDVRMMRTLGQKLCGTGTLEVFARVDTQMKIELKNIKHPKEVNRLLTDLVEKIRDEKKVVGKEFYGIMGHGHGPMGDDGPDGMDGPDDADFDTMDSMDNDQ